mmetsp:Transcript_101841/g.270977  ORF Transcript_101841/g.270977 Transcript_101841/m.270977 type:complete len:119 (-) Transcript_101841:95-451(-)
MELYKVVRYSAEERRQLEDTTASEKMSILTQLIGIAMLPVTIFAVASFARRGSSAAAPAVRQGIGGSGPGLGQRPGARSSTSAPQRSAPLLAAVQLRHASLGSKAPAAALRHWPRPSP